VWQSDPWGALAAKSTEICSELLVELSPLWAEGEAILSARLAQESGESEVSRVSMEIETLLNELWQTRRAWGSWTELTRLT
jgi:hypothetical protein